MSVENPTSQVYEAIIESTETFTLVTCQDRLPDSRTLAILIHMLLAGVAEGLTEQQIVAAAEEGVNTGVLLYENLQRGGGNVEYWRAIRQEAEDFWRARYNSDISENG